jgi:hypothetical protein
MATSDFTGGGGTVNDSLGRAAQQLANDVTSWLLRIGSIYKWLLEKGII